MDEAHAEQSAADRHEATRAESRMIRSAPIQDWAADMPAIVTRLQEETAYLKGRLESIQSSSHSSKVRDIWIPLLSAIIAMLGVMSGISAQYLASRSQLESKHLEVTFQAKQTAYSTLLPPLHTCFIHASQGEVASGFTCVDKLQASYFGLEPFLAPKARTHAWETLQAILALYQDALKSRSLDKHKIQQFTELRDRLRDHLQAELFTGIYR
jgi:hypothetical protein